MESHLLQMRGLKPQNVGRKIRLRHVVASFTDAWIETSFMAIVNGEYGVASFTDAWIETKDNRRERRGAISRIFYRCVD